MMPDRLTLTLLPLLAMGATNVVAQDPDKLFPPDAVIDVTRPPYNAKPDDGRDDTKAIQQAITDHVDTGRTIYLPAGVYDISDSLVWKNKDGLWRPHLTLQGQSREKTFLRLDANTPGFGDPQRPKAMIITGSFWEEGDAADGGGNKAFRNNLFDLTLHVAPGNAGAIGVDWAVSNVGAIENVNVIGQPDKGVAGISVRRRIPGPGLISDTAVYGFNTGIDIGDVQYGMTMHTVVAAHQPGASVQVENNLIHAFDLDTTSENVGIRARGANSVLTMRHGSIGPTDHHKDSLAFDVDGSLRLIDVRDYYSWSSNFKFHGQRFRGSNAFYEEWPEIAQPAGHITLLWPLAFPEYWNADLSGWAPVGPRLPGESDDTKAIQRAIDAGKSTVYFVNDRAYHLSDTVVLRGKVKQILGMGSEITLGAAKKQFSDTANPRPLIRIDETDHKSAVFIENVFFNAQYPGEVIFENNSPATLVIRHCGGWVGANGFRRSYQNTPKSFGGKVFIEDCFLPGWRFEKQKVWARQFNPENHEGDGKTPQVENIGGDLWILGFKTEGPAPFIATRAGGRTELLGAYNYISATAAAKVPEDAVPYIVEDSTAHLTFATDNFRANDYRVYVRAKHGDLIKEWRPQDLPPRNGQPGDRSKVVPLLRVTPPKP